MSKKTETKRRGNHSGRLELRGKKWLAIWMVNGKRQSQSTGETDRAAAEKWLARKLETVKTADGMKALDKDEATIREMQAALLNRLFLGKSHALIFHNSVMTLNTVSWQGQPQKGEPFFRLTVFVVPLGKLRRTVNKLVPEHLKCLCAFFTHAHLFLGHKPFGKGHFFRIYPCYLPNGMNIEASPVLGVHHAAD